jgi:hypothetical protein
MIFKEKSVKYLLFRKIELSVCPSKKPLIKTRKEMKDGGQDKFLKTMKEFE